ncbi:MAG: septum formation protein Maf [Clostridiales bacterium]|nr:septum formation protein Maf [Clostridiales bacterium]
MNNSDNNLKQRQEIILASASARRKDLLGLMGLEFTCIPSEANENIEIVAPNDYVKLLAQRKAHDIAIKHKNACVIGSDTIVVLNNEIIGKPKDIQDAKAILKKLSGKTHTVYTGVCVITNGRELVEVDKTDVTFRKLTDKEIDNYVATGDPMDKAGAYGIQGEFCVHITHMDGNFFTVIGLPVHTLYEMLIKLNVID